MQVYELVGKSLVPSYLNLLTFNKGCNQRVSDICGPYVKDGGLLFVAIIIWIITSNIHTSHKTTELI